MKQMNNLEEQLEFAVFRRTSQGIFLTEAGEVFYQEVLAYIALSKEIIEKARKAIATSQYTIRVGTSFFESLQGNHGFVVALPPSLKLKSFPLMMTIRIY